MDMKRQRIFGFTLLEIMIVIAIIGIISAMAVPSYQDMIERNRLKQAAEGLKSDVQFARTEAIKRSQNVVVSRLPGNAGGWCYGLNVNSNCTCTTAGSCAIKTISGSDFSSAVNMDVPSDTVNNGTFDFRRGTIGANGVTFSTSHFAARVIFSAVGRIKVCTPNPLPTGKTGISGYPAC
jgi:type IV fimbrial biogenesis protein FimT